ncbi:ribosomal protein S18-alanine N-acetyltransferase [Terriglobus sp.]|uniref:ribosomal protein S18-alanine N-acetyltransferase n=1 Tax=Terriglobus sp. TaxID=1889013 RepID=UPI003AFFA778
MIVRPASAADTDDVLAMIRAVPDLPQWGREALAVTTFGVRSAGAPVRRLLVAEDGGKLAGFVQFVVLLDEAELEGMAVQRACRGQGVGRLLLQHAVEIVRADGATRFHLEVRRSNEAALQLYRSAGFVEVGARRSYYAQPVEDALLLQLSLAKNG